MVKTKLKIVNQLGLHARAAAQLVRLAATFKSEIILKRTDDAVFADAKSILSILTLAASKGTELEMTVDGVDEIDALKAIADLFIKGFGEL
jgi:phosphocarrier protein HPr